MEPSEFNSTDPFFTQPILIHINTARVMTVQADFLNNLFKKSTCVLPGDQAGRTGCDGINLNMEVLLSHKAPPSPFLFRFPEDAGCLCARHGCPLVGHAGALVLWSSHQRVPVPKDRLCVCAACDLKPGLCQEGRRAEREKSHLGSTLHQKSLVSNLKQWSFPQSG